MMIRAFASHNDHLVLAFINPLRTGNLRRQDFQSLNEADLRSPMKQTVSSNVMIAIFITVDFEFVPQKH